MRRLQVKSTEPILGRLVLPTVAGLVGAFYSRYVRHHPWPAALAVGLALATLAFTGMKSRQRLQRIYRVSRSPWRRE